MIIDPASFKSARKLRFIALEGVNGAGKSTLQKSLADFLNTKGLEVVATREPGATTLGEKLRAIVLGSAKENVTELSEMFLFAADRADHVARVIKPALTRGAVVLNDRYFYSSLAFQGYGRGLDLNVVNQVNELAIQSTFPDLVVLLDLDPASGLTRNAAGQKKTDKDTFEDKELAFHKRIREGFLSLAKERKEPFLVIDATQPKDLVFEAVRQVVERNL